MLLLKDKNKIAENNKKISKLLKENEEIIRSAGYKPPIKNFTVKDAEKIEFPSGYFRVWQVFYKKYHLKEIVHNDVHRKNIAYALQLADFYNYIGNRFFIWGSIRTMFYKTAIINSVSILEALILECANNICHNASICKNNTCSNKFNKNERNYILLALDRLQQLNIISFNGDEIKHIKKIIGYRNRVHIRLAVENEFDREDFSRKTYNEMTRYLQRICEDIYNNGVPLYNNCLSFNEI